MSDVIRVFVEKREGFDVEARAMLADLRDNLGLKEIRELRLLNRYDVEGLSPEDFMRVRGIVFSEPNVDDVYDETFVLITKMVIFCGSFTCLFYHNPPTK